MASSSSSTKHHVFLSFHGKDTRVGFTSHLHAALKKKNILTFIDDHLKRGEEISDSLVKAIEDSMLSVIMFSQHYASSKWCLDELVKILECRKIKGQIAIPIFYQVDPSDVRKQSGSFGDEFAELVKRKALEMEEERCFRAALNQAANISGHDSQKIGSESKLIEEIVTDVFNKLCKMFPIHPMNLVGIDNRIREIESLLMMQSQVVRIVGIWGMGGIGKTTIAGAVYNKICTEFEAFLFVPNVREKLKSCTVVDLQRSIVSRLLDHEILDMGPLSFENYFIKDGLRHKKVLIVFDDVDRSMPLQELLLEQHDSFGPGSRILVTSRNQHVLNQVVDETYEVHALNNVEALQLLKSKAFKKTDPSSDHEYLFERMVDYAKGNPLALVVLGSTLCDRSIEDWYSALNGLGKVHDVEILNVLRISYDGLNKEQRNIFLDIACFFRGMDRCHVTKILEKKSSSVHYCISILIDKSLITASDNTLWMHDLLQELAYGIVSEESENPRKRSRLIDSEDIYNVLKKRKGTKAVKGICLDMSESREMRLKSDAFAGMHRLEFLIIKGNTSTVQLPNYGLEYLSNRLRYFRWDGYPSRSFPQNLCAEKLVELDLFDSKVEKLWNGQQSLVNLRKINLRFSQYLTKLPDLSKANNLQYVNLEYCQSLIEVPSYFQYLEKLEALFLRGSYNLQCFPRRIDSKNIKRLSLRDCSNIKKSPKISWDMEIIDLSGTTIQEFQQSFGDVRAELFLSGCSHIAKFPEISGNIRKLCLDGTSIEEVPSSIQFLSNLRQLNMNNCKKLSRLPDSICKLKFLEYLDISDCSKLESFPEIMEPMKSLRVLLLNGTAIRELPSSFRHLKYLCYLYLDGTFTKDLPKLPPPLQYLKDNSHNKLKIISCSTLDDSVRELCFPNCFKFEEKALMADKQTKIQFGKIRNFFGMVSSGNKIPPWFSDQSTGSSITIQFPSNRPKLIAFVFCVVVLHPFVTYDVKLCWLAKSDNSGENDDVICSMNSHWFFFEPKVQDHMYISYNNIGPADFSKYFGHEVTFEFYPRVNFAIARHLTVNRCGVRLLFDENPDSPSIS